MCDDVVRRQDNGSVVPNIIPDSPRACKRCLSRAAASARKLCGSLGELAPPGMGRGGAGGAPRGARETAKHIHVIHAIHGFPGGTCDPLMLCGSLGELAPPETEPQAAANNPVVGRGRMW